MAASGLIIPQIRPYQGTSDQHHLLSLVRELQAHEATLFDRMKPSDEIGAEYIDRLLDVEDGEIFVSVGRDNNANSILGYAAVSVQRSSEVDEIPYTFAEMSDLAVSEAARQQGIGKALMERCEEWSKERNIKYFLSLIHI